MKSVLTTAAPALLAAALMQSAAAAPFTHAQPGSQVSFSANQMGVNMAGHFGAPHVEAAFDPADPAHSHVTVVVDAASAAAGGAQTDDLLKSAEWLDAKRFAQARFVSTAITAAGPGHYWVDGQFSVKGRTQALRVPVSAKQTGNTLTLDADFALDRLAWGLGTGAWADTGTVAAKLPVHVHLVLAP